MATATVTLGDDGGKPSVAASATSAAPSSPRCTRCCSCTWARRRASPPRSPRRTRRARLLAHPGSALRPASSGSSRSCRASAPTCATRGTTRTLELHRVRGRRRGDGRHRCVDAGLAWAVWAALAATCATFGALGAYCHLSRRDLSFLEHGLGVGAVAFVFSAAVAACAGGGAALLAPAGSRSLAATSRDTSLLHTLGPDHAVVATLMLYVDVLNLFLTALDCARSALVGDVGLVASPQRLERRVLGRGGGTWSGARPRPSGCARPTARPASSASASSEAPAAAHHSQSHAARLARSAPTSGRGWRRPSGRRRRTGRSKTTGVAARPVQLSVVATVRVAHVDQHVSGVCDIVYVRAVILSSATLRFFLCAPPRPRGSRAFSAYVVFSASVSRRRGRWPRRRAAPRAQRTRSTPATEYAPCLHRKTISRSFGRSPCP